MSLGGRSGRTKCLFAQTARPPFPSTAHSSGRPPAAQAVAYGFEWTRAVVTGATGFNAIKLYALVYDFSQCSVTAAATCGALIALLLGKWMFDGRAPLFVLFFALWAAGAIACCAVLVTLDCNRYIFGNLADLVAGEDDVALGDNVDICDGVDGWLRTYCKDARPVCVLLVSGLLLFGIGGQVLFWLFYLFGQCACFPKFGNRNVETAIPERIKPFTDKTYTSLPAMTFRP